MGHGGTARVLGAETLEVEDYHLDFENDIAFMNKHRINMQVLFYSKMDFSDISPLISSLNLHMLTR
jgi:hypothetical protein